MPALDPSLGALVALLALDRLPRTGWIQHGVPDPESIAGHVLGTAYLALHLAPREEPPLDLGRVLTLALVHDAPEALTGDLPRTAARFLPEGAKATMDAAAALALLEPLGAPALDAAREYLAAASREARFVRTCDGLQLGLRTLAYARAGQRGLEPFRASLVELDCGEFHAAAALRAEILRALDSGGQRTPAPRSR